MEKRITEITEEMREHRGLVRAFECGGSAGEMRGFFAALRMTIEAWGTPGDSAA